MKETEPPAPLVLNGRVFVSGALEESFPSQRCPANPEAGSLRIHSHLDEEGTKARALGFCKQGYSGMIRASIFDGKHWRKFMLARECAVEQRNFPNFLQRASKAQVVLRTLALLKGKTCVHRDGAFAVKHAIPVAAAPSPAASAAGKASSAVAATNIEKGKAIKQQATLFPEAEPTPVAACKTRRKNSSSTGRKRKRRTKSNPHQRELF